MIIEMCLIGNGGVCKQVDTGGLAPCLVLFAADSSNPVWILHGHGDQLAEHFLPCDISEACGYRHVATPQSFVPTAAAPSEERLRDTSVSLASGSIQRAILAHPLRWFGSNDLPQHH